MGSRAETVRISALFSFYVKNILINQYIFSLWLTDNKILVNFDYELTWDYLLVDWNQSTKRQSEIILVKEDGKYKIDTLLDNGLFTENNSFTKEW